jgi:hypothetical protein
MPLAVALAGLFSAPPIPKDSGYAVQEIRDALHWITDGAYNRGGRTVSPIARRISRTIAGRWSKR